VHGPRPASAAARLDRARRFGRHRGARRGAPGVRVVVARSGSRWLDSNSDRGRVCRACTSFGCRASSWIFDRAWPHRAPISFPQRCARELIDDRVLGPHRSRKLDDLARRGLGAAISPSWAASRGPMRSASSARSEGLLVGAEQDMANRSV